jgi:hypothetical protein
MIEHDTDADFYVDDVFIFLLVMVTTMNDCVSGDDDGHDHGEPSSWRNTTNK